MVSIRKDLFRCGEGRMVFSVRECHNASDLSEYIEKGGGLAIRSDDFSYDGDGGPYTINLVNSTRNVIECSSREAFSSEFILMCCLKSTILPLKNYWLKRSDRFNAEFDPQDVLFQEISWFDAESLFSAHQHNENSTCSASVVEFNMNQTNVKQEQIIQPRVRTPPLFSEDEISQNPVSLVAINGLVPIIKLKRVDASQILEECAQQWREINEDSNLINLESSSVETKPLTENKPLVTPPSSGDDSDITTNRSRENSNQKRKLNCITDSENSAHDTGPPKSPSRLKKTSCTNEKQVKRRAHRLSVRRVLLNSFSSSSSDADEPTLVQSKKNLRVIKTNTINTTKNQDNSHRTNNLQTEVNVRGAYATTSAEEREASSQRGLITSTTKKPVLPQNFYAELINFVESTSSSPSSSPNHQHDISRCNISSDEMAQRQKRKTSRQRLVEETSDARVVSPTVSNSIENCRPQLHDSLVNKSLEVKCVSIQCDFEEPLCKDVAVETIPTKVIPLDCVPTGSYLSNPPDLICQTDFVEPVLCDGVCQTMDVIVKPTTMEDCIVFLMKDCIVSPQAQESRNAVAPSLAENEEPLTSEHCGHQELSSEANSSDSAEGLFKQHYKSCFYRNEFHTSANGPLTPENLVLPSDSCAQDSPNKDNLQASSSRSSQKKKPSQPKVSSSERCTRLSARKVTRLCVASHRKNYSEGKKP